MNKYQTVLDKFINDGHRLTHRERNEFGAILQELVDKETPKEVINTGLVIQCPKCFTMFPFVKGPLGPCVTISQYCQYCGQKLGSDTDE